METAGSCIDGVTQNIPDCRCLVFGAGGANAHVVIEEYIPKDQEPRLALLPWRSNPPVIVLSAKNEERLKEQVQQLLAAIKERQLSR